MALIAAIFGITGIAAVCAGFITVSPEHIRPLCTVGGILLGSATGALACATEKSAYWVEEAEA